MIFHQRPRTTMETAELFALHDDSDVIAFAAQPERSEYEIERGKPMPSKNHGSIQANLIVLLARYKKQYRTISELTIALAEYNATPDICLYPQMTLDFLHDEYPLAVPPLLAIEIISPSQSFTEFIAKAESYFAAGVQSCWVVQPPTQTVTVLHPNEKPRTFVEGSVEDPIMGITIPLAEVFE